MRASKKGLNKMYNRHVTDFKKFGYAAVNLINVLSNFQVFGLIVHCQNDWFEMYTVYTFSIACRGGGGQELPFLVLVYW